MVSLDPMPTEIIQLPPKRFSGHDYRIKDDADGNARVWRGNKRLGAWDALTRSEILAIDTDSELWAWLFAQGFRRPSPSGTQGPGQSHKKRAAAGRVAVQVYLSNETANELTDLVRVHGTKKDAISSSIHEAWVRLKKK